MIENFILILILISKAVQQWGAVIAVNYKSREYGVKRGDTMNEIKKKCPHIKLIQKLISDQLHLLLDR